MPTLSESASKELLVEYGVPVLDERTVSSVDAAVTAAAEVGFPVVLKLCGDAIAHKTERGLVRLSLRDADAVRDAGSALLAAARPEDGEVGLLVAPMVSGTRELIAGLVRDEQFGPCVMIGVGGVLAEALGDVAFRLVPLDDLDGWDIVDDLATQRLLGPFRGEPGVDRVTLAAILRGLSRLAIERPDVVAVDLNPLIVVDGKPVAVDALVELGEPAPIPTVPAVPADDRFLPLFEPRGVVVAGASTHPGKFGFVALHNIIAAGYEGMIGATNLEGAPVLGIDTVASIDELPPGPWDLVFVCTPAAANLDLLRGCAKQGIRAAFLTSAGYGEAGPEGERAQRELVALADELGILLAGPNGQGVVSTPVKLFAQIVAPNPPRGRIAIASQSGNFVSSFQNWAVQTGVGVSRAVSAGNAAAVGIADYLEWYAQDPETAVSLAYVEGVRDGRALYDRLHAVALRKPVVLVKGGTTSGGQRAAASHTGSLASDDRVFDGMCRQAGITRASTVEEAFEAAATFATQPLPKGPRTAVLTTAGGWGVVTADAIVRTRTLELCPLPDDLRAAIDEKLPPRWSRNNPIDFAGGETRDTIPDVMGLVANHPDIDAIVYLGLGIQSNQAQLMRAGSLYPDHGLERIVDYHERQDARFAQAAADISSATGKPILTATELAVAAPDNAGPRYRPRDGTSLLRVREPRRHRAGPPVALRRVPHRTRRLTRRGRAGLRVLATVMVAAAIAVVGGAARDEDDAAAVPAPGPGPAKSPLLSARRIPYVFSDAVARERLGAGLDVFASQYDTCVAVDETAVDETAGDDTPLVDLHHDRLLAPASNMKLLTAAAALATFDEDHRFVTRAAVDDTGNLYLIGGGDSLLGSGAFEEELHAMPRNATTPVTRIEPLADAVASAGIGPVTAIVADDTRHDDLRFLPEWKASYRDDIGPLGALTVNGGRSGGVTVADPARFAAEQFATLLAQRGVTVGTVTTGRAPDGAREIAAVASPVVGDVVAAMLTSSDNLTAELLMREIGVARGGDGTTTAGTTAVIEALDTVGIPTADLVVRDGSGLAPTNRVTCAALLATLRLDDPRFSALDRGLAVAGRTGTLVTRFQGDALEGVLRAKTGRIDGAVALSGIVDDAEHLHFAFVANGDFSSSRGEALQAEVARLVAAYPDAPNPSEIAPSP